MRDILEGLPHALLPDPARESEDPGIARDLIDDDLVRPLVEEDVPMRAEGAAARSRRSPLARDVEVTVDPFDPRLSTPLGVTLYVEGQRVRLAALTLGHVHQGIERRAAGLPIDALTELVGAVAPGPVAQLAVAAAVERLSGVREHASVWRTAALDLVAVADHAAVLADVARRRPTAQARLRAVVASARAALAGLDMAALARPSAGLRLAPADDERATLARRVDDLARARDRLDAAALIDELGSLRGVAEVSAARARALGIDGPALAAAGGDATLTVELGAALTPPPLDSVAATGCVVARAEVRLRGLDGAIARLRAPRVAEGTSAASADQGDLEGTTQALVRGPLGTLACLMHVRAGHVHRLRLRPPDLPLVVAVATALRGVRLDDVGEALASFGLHASALDR